MSERVNIGDFSCPGCGRTYTPDDLQYDPVCGMEECGLTEQASEVAAYTAAVLGGK